MTDIVSLPQTTMDNQAARANRWRRSTRTLAQCFELPEQDTGLLFVSCAQDAASREMAAVICYAVSINPPWVQARGNDFKRHCMSGRLQLMIHGVLVTCILECWKARKSCTQHIMHSNDCRELINLNEYNAPPSQRVPPCAILITATFRKPLRLKVDPFLRVSTLFILITSLRNTGSLESLQLAVIDWTDEVDLGMVSQ